MSRSGLPTVISNLVSKNPVAAPQIVKILAAQGIIKYRAAQRVQSAEDLKGLDSTDFSRFISHKRMSAASQAFTNTLISPEIRAENPGVNFFPVEEVSSGLVSRAAQSASDVLAGIKTSLLYAEELSGKETTPAHKSSFLTAGTPLRKSVALGLLAAISMGTLSACGPVTIQALSKGAIAAVGYAIGLPVVPVILGVVGVGIVVGLGKALFSPAFRDSAQRSIFPVTVSILSYVVRYLAIAGLESMLPTSSIWLNIFAMMAQWGFVFVAEAGRFALQQYSPIRIGSFGREGYRKEALENDPEIRVHRAKQNIAFEIIRGNKDVMDVGSLRTAVQTVNGRSSNSEVDIDKLEKALKKCNNPEKAMALWENFHIEHTRAIMDINVADPATVILSRMSRIFSWNYLPFILLPYTAAGFSWVNAMLYTVFALSSVYYHIGTVWSMKMIESAEYVENTGFPELDGKSHPVITTIRYSNKGLMDRKGYVPAYMTADIENRIEHGEYYVVFNNDSPNHFAFQVFGGVKMVEKIQARMHYLIEEEDFFDGMDISPKEQMRLAFILSCREYEKNPMVIVDNAINHVYPEAPAKGQAIRFRDGYSKFMKKITKKMRKGMTGNVRHANRSIGDGGGENSCFAALADFVDRNFSDARKTDVIASLKQLIVVENQLDLIGIQDEEKLDALFDALQRRTGVDCSGLKAMIKEEDRIELNAILTDSLMATAIAAGMDEHRAFGVAREIVRRSKQTVEFGAIAEVADNIRLGLKVEDKENKQAAENITRNFGTNGAVVLDELQAIASEVEQGADRISQTATVPTGTFFKMWRYAQVALSLFRQGSSAEEGNLMRLYEYYSEKSIAGTLDSREREEFEYLTKAYVGHIRGMKDDANKKLSVAMMARKGVEWAKERGEDITEDSLRETLTAYTRNNNPEDPAIPSLVPLMNSLIVDSLLGTERAFWKHNSNAGLMIARRMQSTLINRGWLDSVLPFKSRFRRKVVDNVSRSIGLSLAKRAASFQPTMKDYVDCAEEHKDLSIEAIQKMVWKKFIKRLHDETEVVIDQQIAGNKLIKKTLSANREDLIELAQEAAAEEFTENSNNIFRLAWGMASSLPQEIQGMRNMKVDNELEETYLASERAKKIAKDRVAALAGIEALLAGSDSKKGEALGKLEDDVKTLLDGGVGDKSGQKGYSHIFGRIIHFIPKAYLQRKPFFIKQKKTQLMIFDTKRKKFKSDAIVYIDPKFEAEMTALLDQLVGAEVETRRLKRDVQLWAYSRTNGENLVRDIDRETGVNRELSEVDRVCSQADSFQIAEKIVAKLLENPDADIDLSSSAVSLVNGVINATMGGGSLLGEQRQELLEEVAKGLDATEVKDKIIIPEAPSRTNFDPVYRFHRLFGEWWLKGKDVNTNMEFHGGRVHEQVGTMFRYLMKVHFTEKLGFVRIPIFLSERIKIEVSDLLRFHTSKRDDAKFKREHRLTHEDISRRLLKRIAGTETEKGVKAEDAARTLWGEIERLLEANNSVGITEDFNRMSSIEVIRKNLEECASEVAVLYYGAQLVEGLHAGSDAKTMVEKWRSDGLIGSKEAGELMSLATEETRRTKKDDYLRKQVEAARKSGNVELALEIELRMTHREDANHSTHYRHGSNRPELLTGEARSLTELSGWLSSMQKAAEYSIESGELFGDAKLLRDCAKEGDALLNDIAGMTDADISATYRLTIEDARILKARTTKIDPRTFEGFSQSEGEALDRRIDIFTRILNKRLQEKEKKSRRDNLGQKYQEVDREKDTVTVDLSKIVFINPLDERRFPKTVMEQVKTDVQMNADTDNIFYKELLEASAHFSFLHGIFVNPNEVCQYGLNYEVGDRGNFGRFQRNRDLGGPQNKAALWSNLTQIGKSRHRASMIEFAGTLTGYANLFPIHLGMQAAEYVIEPNNAKSSYYGQRALAWILRDDKWWEKSDPFKKHLHESTKDKFLYKLNRNPLNILMGWDNGWDASMAVERAARLIPFVALSALFLGKVVNLIHGGIFDASMEFSPSPVELGGITMSTLTLISGVSLGVWSIMKGIARVMGRGIERNQLFRGRRLYVIDPSEDLATSMPLRARGIRLTMLKGGRELNDAMTDWEGEMFQKLRWQASNAANFGRALSYVWEYRKVMTFKESFDLLQAPSYNMFGIPGLFNRIAILLFVIMGESTVLVNKSFDLMESLFRQDNLKWLVELGFVNYLTIELTLRLSRMKAGASWGGIGMNFAYESTMLGFNYMNVMRRFGSGEKAAFNVTDPLAQEAQVAPWGIAATSSRFLTRNRFMMALEFLALYRIFGGHMAEALQNLDFWQVYMATLLFWVGSKVYYNIKGHRMNGGISYLETEAKWMDAKGAWLTDFGSGYIDDANRPNYNNPK